MCSIFDHDALHSHGTITGSTGLINPLHQILTMPVWNILIQLAINYEKVRGFTILLGMTHQLFHFHVIAPWIGQDGLQQTGQEPIAKTYIRLEEHVNIKV